MLNKNKYRKHTITNINKIKGANTINHTNILLPRLNKYSKNIEINKKNKKNLKINFLFNFKNVCINNIDIFEIK
jgi:hypothetical protein